MHLLQTPTAMLKRGIKFPDIMVVLPGETVPVGTPFVRAFDWETDEFLVYRIILPSLLSNHPAWNWMEIYTELTGRKFEEAEVKVNVHDAGEDFEGNSYTTPCDKEETKSLEELGMDPSWIDVDVLMDMKIMPTFMHDIQQAVRKNVTNYWSWTDGYNKKTGLCTGYLTQTELPKVLIIIDVSWSIPSGVSTGLLTMMSTMADYTNADVIITGGTSIFLSNEEAVNADPREIRRKVPRSNEGDMFADILRTHDMGYDTVICFGDSDNPDSALRGVKAKNADKIRTIHSYFIGRFDRYGANYTKVAGYVRWAERASRNANVFHHTDWAKCFNKDDC